MGEPRHLIDELQQHTSNLTNLLKDIGMSVDNKIQAEIDKAILQLHFRGSCQGGAK